MWNTECSSSYFSPRNVSTTYITNFSYNSSTKSASWTATFLFAILLAMSPPRSDHLICLANNFGSNSGRRNTVWSFLADHLPVVVSNVKNNTTKEALRNSTADILSNSADIIANTVQKRIGCSRPETSGAISWTKSASGMYQGRTIKSERESRK